MNHLMSLRLRTDNLSWQLTGENIVVLDLTSSVYLQLSGSGRLLWECLAEGATRDELIDALVNRYEIDADRAGADVDDFLSDLTDRGLLAD